MKLRTAIRALHPRSVFRISRAQRREVRNVFVRIAADGGCGFGEASPNAYYDETAERVEAALANAAPFLADLEIRSVEDIARAWTEAQRFLGSSHAAQCALDVALWDWLARREGVSVCELAWGAKPRAIESFCTIGISAPDELPAKVAELRDHPLIKIKSDERADLSAAEFLRARSAARLAIDANCAWAQHDVPALSRLAAELGVLFLEQPLPPAEDARMPEILPASALPIFADESCVTPADLERLPGRFSGFNIKLVKCGGLTPALEMVRRGRELGLSVMVGCMLESSVLIAAGAVIAQRADYADLDGAWLLGDDPFAGPPFRNGRLLTSMQPGLGVSDRAGIFAPAELRGSQGICKDARCC